MRFQSKQSESRFLFLIARDDTANSDKERIALFYIIAGNDDLFEKHRFIYNFDQHMIELCLDDGEMLESLQGPSEVSTADDLDDDLEI